MDSEDIREVEFLADHVVCKGKWYTDSKILVTSEFIQLEIRGCIIYKWVIANIVHITSCWDESIQSVIVKICADIDGVYTPGHTLEFAVGLPSWNRKLKEIKSLNDNYKSLWKNYIKSEDTNSVPGHNGSTFEEDIPCTYWELVYPKGDTDAITITQRDIDLLEPKGWLNNTIIDFYLKYLRNEMDPDESHRFHFLSSFFFAKMATHVKDPLVASKGLKAFQHVKGWTEKVDLFKKELIFMPIIYNGHWSLIVILNFGELAKNEVGDVNGPVPLPCVLHLDSLRNNHAGLKEFVHSYLREEWKSRASENISRFDRLKFIYLKQLPQQENGHDCGLFLLHYAQLFLKEFLACSTCQVMDGSKFLKADWFTPSEASDKRMVIKQLIYDLKEKQKSTFNVDNDNQYQFRCRSSQDNQENGLFSILDNHCYVDQFSCPTEGSIPQCVPGSSEDNLSVLLNDFCEDYKLSCPTEGSIPPGVPGISEDDLSAEFEAYYRCL